MINPQTTTTKNALPRTKSPHSKEDSSTIQRTRLIVLSWINMAPMSTSVQCGSRFQQMVLAESSQSYSERDFQMKACISAAGPTPIGKLDISACSNGTSSKRSKASKMSVSETRFVRGGLRATNSELANGETSAELIKKLIKEADEATSPSPV